MILAVALVSFVVGSGTWYLFAPRDELFNRVDLFKNFTVSGKYVAGSEFLSTLRTFNASSSDVEDQVYLISKVELISTNNPGRPCYLEMDISGPEISRPPPLSAGTNIPFEKVSIHIGGGWFKKGKPVYSITKVGTFTELEFLKLSRDQVLDLKPAYDVVKLLICK